MNLTITHKHLRNILNNLTDKNFNDLLIELQYSTLIIPVNEFSGVPILENGCLPLYTDLNEFNKFKNHPEFRPVDHEFNFYLELLMDKKAEGFIINPESEKFKIKEGFLEVIQPNYIFNQDYRPFTTREIISLKDSFDNAELNGFIKDKSNLYNLDELLNKLNDSLLLTLLVSNKNYQDKADNGVFSPLGIIPKCVYEVGDRNYLLIFSRELTSHSIPHNIFKYSQIVNFPLLVEEALNLDFDGLILNVDEENITIPRENLRNFMKGFNSPCLDYYGGYVFTVPECE